MIDIKRFRDDKNIVQKEICEVLNIAQPYLSAIEKGKRPLNEDKFKLLYKHYGDIILEYKKADVIIQVGQESLNQTTKPNATSVKGNIRYWVDVDATAGGVQLFGDTITKRYIDLQIPEFRDCTDAVNLYGDSMLPLYKSGQIIILKEWTESFIDFGNVYLVITKEGNRMVKYLRKADVAEKVLCVSENKDFDPFPIDRADILRLYIVKGAISKNVL